MSSRMVSRAGGNTAAKLGTATILIVLVLTLTGLPAQTLPSPKDAAAFEHAVLPILEKHCLQCHSGSAPQAGLDVRSRTSLIKGGSQGTAIVPGSARESLLYRRVLDGEMPMGSQRLSQVELETIRRWIDEGALASNPEPALPVSSIDDPGDREHWAFQPPKRPSPPEVRQRQRVRNSIDAFVLAELEKQGLSFSSEADPIALMRRAHFDLIGLPPSPQQVDDFLLDPSTRGYQKMIDGLLNSPHYGERWGRHWLDIAGYADSEGGEAADVVRDFAWRYRDYVIRAFNSDKPYDLFLREQLAGDELSEFRQHDGLPPDVVEPLVATGFLRMAADGTSPGHPGNLNNHYLWRMLFDTQQIVGSALMGVTLHCARCHDHKYEPISQKEYYGLQAIFSGAIRPLGPVLTSKKRRIFEATRAEQESASQVNKPLEEVVKALKSLQQARRTQYQAKHPKREAAEEPELREMFPDYASIAERLEKEIKEEEAKRIHLTAIRALYDMDADPPRTRVLRRGDYESPEALEASPGIPRVLDDEERPFQVPAPEPDAKTSGRRRSFAQWLTRSSHPITARLMVNRIWAHHFGKGIVPSTDNFGRSGALPSHPALLDWLATEFVRAGWSVKSIHRLIMASTVYRQRSQAHAEGLAIDPDNKLLWRMNPRRLEAEIVRDSMLAVSGTLDPKMYGQPVKTETKATGEIVPEGDAIGGRRSIYQIVRRSAPQSLLEVFDAPIIEVNCPERSTSTTASQALALMNSEFVGSQAELFARRVLKEAPPFSPVDADTVEYAFRLALSREPISGERQMLLAFLEQQVEQHAELSGEAKVLRIYANLCQSLLNTNEFVYVD